MKLFRKIQYKLKYFISPVPEPEKWVFIAGCSNSGTTLLHALLARHPQIGSLPDEGQFCTNQLPLTRDVGLKRLWAVPPEKLYLNEKGSPQINVTKLKKQWAARFNDMSRPILLEKSPPNTVRLRWLQAQFPNANFIGIHRNGYAVAEGIKRKVGHPVELGAKQWNNANQILLEDFEKLNHKLLISYEDLTDHTAETMKKILDFLSLPDLDKTIIKTPIRIHGKEKRIENMNAISILNLSSTEKTEIEKEAKDMLQKLNYFQRSTPVLL